MFPIQKTFCIFALPKNTKVFALKQANRYHHLLKSLVFLLLLGHGWQQVGSYLYDTQKNKLHLIDLYQTTDTDLEKESEKKQGDKEPSKDQLIFSSIYLYPNTRLLPAGPKQDGQHPLLHHLEIPTPPPECSHI